MTKYVVKGRSILYIELLLACILGILLLATACCGCFAAPKIAESNELDARFASAQREATMRLNAGTPDEHRLALYSYLRQANEGDVRGQRPGFFDNARQKEKYDAWASLKGMSREEAKERYIDTVYRLA